MTLRRISKRQFDAYCYSREPRAPFITEEIAWFEASNKKLLCLVFRDKIDGDYGYVILGRDKRHLFRGIGGSAGHLDPQQAVDALTMGIAQYINDGQDNYPQGDDTSKPHEIFAPIVPSNKQHPAFKLLSNQSHFSAAKNIIEEIALSFVDVDGNYIQQFQSDGFDARLWELFLYAYLHNSGFSFDRSFSSPDYCLNKLGYECFIEAVTVGPNSEFDAPNASGPEDIVELSKNYLPIKYGSALFSKLNKKPPYWELSHVKNKPLIFAIHDYHIAADMTSTGSMTWTRSGLVNYLYGMRHEIEVNAEGELAPVLIAPSVIPTVKKVKTEHHTYGKKTIPSHFFKQLGAEHVSAVFFSNGATLSTFNRMGKLAKLGGEDVTLIRRGTRFNPAPDALRPLEFSIDIDDPAYEEGWGDSIVMYHNPYALVPVMAEAFPEITHMYYEEATDEFRTECNPNEIFSSVTVIVRTHE